MAPVLVCIMASLWSIPRGFSLVYNAKALHARAEISSQYNDINDEGENYASYAMGSMAVSDLRHRTGNGNRY